MNKSAEALRVEAHIWCDCRCREHADKTLHGCSVACECCRYRHLAIDLYAAARAVEVAGGMHAEQCWCHGGDCYIRSVLTQERVDETTVRQTIAKDADHPHPYTDPRCTEARARYRAELERLTHA